MTSSKINANEPVRFVEEEAKENEYRLKWHDYVKNEVWHIILIQRIPYLMYGLMLESDHAKNKYDGKFLWADWHEVENAPKEVML